MFDFSRFLTHIKKIKYNFLHQPFPQPGLHHYEKVQRIGKSRIHLRIDEDLSGILLINANRIINLNPTAVVMTWLFLEKYPEQQSINILRKTFRVSNKQAASDFKYFCGQLHDLIIPDSVCPIHDLNLDVIAPFSSKPSAPYRMDMAITYKCNNDCFHCYNARSRDFPEISTNQWKSIIDKTWDVGIPHIVFTGGEPTLRSDLPDLITYAEKKGQITGLNTNARRLSNQNYLHKLVDAGLDHVQVTVESHDPLIHDRMVNFKGAYSQTIKGLNNALESPLFVMTNTTLLKENSPKLKQTLIFLSSLGVPTIGLNALIYSGKGATVGTGISEEELYELLEFAQEFTQENNQKLIWYTPTQYCNFDPMKLELGIKGCTAALYNMCIEPNGDVIPCQSFYHPVGNIMADPWENIWNHNLCLSLRERKYLPEKCNGCVLVQECGGGCPLLYQIDDLSQTQGF